MEGCRRHHQLFPQEGPQLHLAAAPGGIQQGCIQLSAEQPALQYRGIVHQHLHPDLRVLGLKGLHHRHEQLFGQHHGGADAQQLLPGILLHAALHALVNAQQFPGMAQQLLGLPG